MPKRGQLGRSDMRFKSVRAASTLVGDPGCSNGDGYVDGRQRISRRALLGAGLAGGAGIAALPLFTLTDRVTEQQTKAASSGLPFNSGWLFGGAYQPGAEAADYDDSGFTPVTVPHTAALTGMSWSGWNPEAWEAVWIYRRRF